MELYNMTHLPSFNNRLTLVSESFHLPFFGFILSYLSRNCVDTLLQKGKQSSITKKMYQALRPISEITDRTRRWTAKVLVLQKFIPRQSQKSSHRYQKLLFIDKDETKVQAVIFNEDIKGMEGTLELQETYLIANAKVETANSRYNVTEHPYQWVIDKTTVIRHILHDSLPKELTNYPYHETWRTRLLVQLFQLILLKLPFKDDKRTMKVSHFGIVNTWSDKTCREALPNLL